MSVVLGLSLTVSSAVWVLVDTDDGGILADDVVAVDSVHEIARAAALSVQAFDSRTEHNIDAVRLTWDDDAHQHGVRLRTKLRLFGFEPVETVSAEAARAGRNKTARHLPPHLAPAYGAARADRDFDDDGNMLQTLFRQIKTRVPLRIAVAASAAAALAVGLGLVAFEGSSTGEKPPTAAEPAAAQSAAAPSGPGVVPAPAAAAPTPVVPPGVAAPVAAPAPSRTADPVPTWLPATTVDEPENVVPEVVTEIELDSTVTASLPANGGVPHLSGTPARIPAPTEADTAVPTGTAVHGTSLHGVGPAPSAPNHLSTPGTGQAVSPPPAVLPAPLPPPLSSLFDALP